MEIITDFRHLMKLAYIKAGTEEAKKNHDAYRDLCLKSNKIAIGLTMGELGK
jgi:hypothetical protein